MLIKRNINLIASFIAVLFLSFSFVYALAASVSFSISPFVIFFIVLFFAGLCFFTFVEKKRIYIYLITYASLLAILFIYLTLENGLIESLDNYFTWITDSFFGNYSRAILYELFTLSILSTLVTCFIYIFTIYKFNVFVILGSGLALFIYLKINDMDNKSIIPFTIFIFFALLSYFTHVYRKSMANSSTDDIKHQSMFYSMVIPFCLAVVAITLAIPVSSRPLELKWLDRQWNRFYDLIRKLNGFEYFSLPYVGYGFNEQWLGGNVVLDMTPSLDINSPERTLYLKGAIKDYYTGNSWKKRNRRLYSLDKDGNILKSDLKEALNGLTLFLLSPNSADSYFLHDDIKVTFRELKTKSLFIPSLTENLTFNTPGGTDLFYDSNSVLSTRKKHGRNFSYSFKAYTPKYYSISLQNVLRKSYKGIYRNALSELDNIVDKINNIDTDSKTGTSKNGVTTKDSTLGIYTFSHSGREYIIVNLKGKKSMSSKQKAFISSMLEASSGPVPAVVHVTLDNGKKLSSADICKDVFGLTIEELKALVAKADRIYMEYLQLPDNLPERIEKLARDITKASQSNYDKARAIENYLSKNYEYTLSPGGTPENYDFADYFLFETKKGYNVHYATAMTVMLRSIGIPARYVEGYRLPVNAGDPPVYHLTNANAHAWVEAYFEGYGWLAFEPSSRYTEFFYKKYNKPAPAPAPTPTPSPQPVEEEATEIGPENTGEGLQELPIIDESLEPGATVQPGLQDDENAEQKLDEYQDNHPDEEFMEPPEKQEEETTEQETTEEPENKEQKSKEEKKSKNKAGENLAAFFRAFLWIFLLILRIVLYILIPVIIIALIIFINHTRYKNKIRRMASAHPRKSVLMLYKYYLKLLALLGFKLNNNETALQFSKKLNDGYNGDMSSFYRVTEIFMKARYSMNNLTDEEKVECLEFLDFLLSEMERNMGKYKFRFMKYILGVI